MKPPPVLILFLSVPNFFAGGVFTLSSGMFWIVLRKPDSRLRTSDLTNSFFLFVKFWQHIQITIILFYLLLKNSRNMASPSTKVKLDQDSRFNAQISWFSWKLCPCLIDLWPNFLAILDILRNYWASFAKYEPWSHLISSFT